MPQLLRSICQIDETEHFSGKEIVISSSTDGMQSKTTGLSMMLLMEVRHLVISMMLQMESTGKAEM